MVEGIVVMRVSVTESGCMDTGEVIGSSGAADLDEAALLWAERAKYVPAAKEGKNVPGTFHYRVNFELR